MHIDVRGFYTFIHYLCHCSWNHVLPNASNKKICSWFYRHERETEHVPRHSTAKFSLWVFLASTNSHNRDRIVPIYLWKTGDRFEAGFDTVRLRKRLVLRTCPTDSMERGSPLQYTFPRRMCARYILILSYCLFFRLRHLRAARNVSSRTKYLQFCCGEECICVAQHRALIFALGVWILTAVCWWISNEHSHNNIHRLYQWIAA